MAIDNFSGGFRFLSNFWPSKVHLDGMEFSSIEHAYQAAKTLDKEHRLKIRNAKTANEAKKIGKSIVLRKDWESIKLDIMLNLIREKFAIPELRQLLIDTGDTELVEGNWWGDRFWGVCRGKGLNNLGKLLMKVRNEIKKVVCSNCKSLNGKELGLHTCPFALEIRGNDLLCNCCEYCQKNCADDI